MIAGLVLAGGAGTRFGGRESKLLADVGGRPLLEWSVLAPCQVPELEHVVVVLGSHADEIRQRTWFGRAEPVVCDGWETGQSASLRCGLAVLNQAEKVIVTLGDEPLMTPAAIARFVDEPGGTRAVFDGRPGHPVVLGREQLDALRALTGDHGARELLRGGREIEAGHLCSARDVDTPDDLEAIRDEARAGI